jgi:flagellar basal-body rod modification protein FlgD
MTTPISGSAADYIGATTGTTSAKASKDLDKDAFLKLMVAQLKYQDPTKPNDGTEFLAQTAQFTLVEKLTEMAKGQSQLLSAQLMLGASNLVGRTVSYTDANGMTATGVVSSATFSGSTPTLRVGDTDVALSSVKEVRNANS